MDINILNSPSGTVLRLTTLGQLTIAGDSEETASLGRQRRKLAVLVVLALSGRPRSRDSLADMFWGDQDAERARHSLSEALSHIRRALGRDAVATRLTDISLSTKAPLFVDAVEFERRVRTGELAGAIDLYEGAFLDGVHVEGSAAFEHWVDERRAYYERLFVKAASAHCEALARSRQWDACASVAARWLALTPLSPDAALYLLNARKAVGSRDNLERATSDFEQLRARLRREYDTEPDPVVAELARSIEDALERLAPVAVVPSPILPPAPEGADDRTERAETIPAPSERVAASPASPRRRRITAALAILALLLAGVSLTVATRSRKSATGRPTRIAVVPFTHIGGDSATAYFTHGMTEEVSVALGGVDGVRVLPVSSTGSPDRDDVQALGRRLGADAILAGSVRPDGDSARIIVRLVSASDGYQLWAGHFERRLGAAAGVQEDIATAIATALHRRLTSASGAATDRSAVDPETYDLYLRGRYFDNRSGEANLRRAMDYYQRALARDSTFAPAYAGLASAQVTLFGWGHSYAETVPLARQYADRALALDPALGVAHYVLGRLDWYDWRWADSEREYLRAIAANPSDVQSHHMLSHTYLALGKLDESYVESRKALELDPLNPRIGLHLCVHYMFARRFDDALAACERGVELDSEFPDAHAKLAFVNLFKGRVDQARVEIEREMAITGRLPLYLAQLAMIEAAAGHEQAARELIAGLHAHEAPARLPLYYIAATHLRLGEIDSAMTRLEEAYSNHSSDLDGLALDPLFDPLRRDARFAALLQKLGEAPGRGG